MPYRIKARNSAGHTVTRWDMRGGPSPRDLRQAELIAEEFALTRGAYGPWQGFVEYYADQDSITAPAVKKGTDHLTAGVKPGRRPV